MYIQILTQLQKKKKILKRIFLLMHSLYFEKHLYVWVKWSVEFFKKIIEIINVVIIITMS